LAVHLTRRGDVRADSAFEEALTAATDVHWEQSHVDALLELAAARPDFQRVDQIQRVALLIERNDTRTTVLARLAAAVRPEHPARSRELFALAEQTAREEWADYDRSDALSRVSRALAEVSEWDEALRISGTIEHANDRIAALSYIAGVMMRKGDSRGSALMEEGLAVADEAPRRELLEVDELRRRAAHLTRKRDTGAAAAWSAANELAGSLWRGLIWIDAEGRARGLLEIAANLVDESRRAETLELAHSAACEVPYENARATTLLAVMRRMIDDGRCDAAEKVLAEIHVKDDRRKAITECVEAYRALSQPDSALRVARLEASDDDRRSIMRDVALAFAKANRMPDALKVLEETTLDGFIAAVAFAHAAWTDAPPGAVLSSMQAITAVAAWVRPDWREIHDMLRA
jgi:hypothetical protein